MHTQEEIMQQYFNASCFEAFIQECLQAKLHNGLNDNPLYSFITQTRYALTQSNPLSQQNKAIFEKLTDDIDKPMRIAIIGQFSSGKSTFLNALLGKEILPSGITPVTAKVCEITYGEEIALEVLYKNGKSINKPITYLNEVDEMENAKIAYYRLSVPLALLQKVNFLDTPGFNSQNESDTNTTNSILEEVDGIIWLTLIDNVGKNSEKEILQTHIKRYANKSLCVLNQKDRCKNQEEIDTSLNYAKKAFEGFFEDIIAISAKQAIDAIHLQNSTQNLSDETDMGFLHSGFLAHYNNISKNEDSKAMQLFQESNMKSVLDFISTTITNGAREAKQYRILRSLRTLLVQEKRKLHKINRAYKDLAKILEIYIQKVRFNALQSGLERQFLKFFPILDSKIDILAQKIFNSFELKSFEITRESKNYFGFTKHTQQTKEVNVLPKDKLLSQLYNDDNQIARDLKQFGFQLSEFGQHFAKFMENQTKDLHNQLDFWREKTLQNLYFAYSSDMALSDGILDRHFRIEVLDLEIFIDYDKIAEKCVQFLQQELDFLQRSLTNNFQNTILLCLEKLNFEVENALSKHKKSPDTLPLYNPTLENVRDLLNLGLHFNMYQERLSLNFPLYKKALWNLNQDLMQLYNAKQDKITQWILSNQEKYNILQRCEDSIKAIS